MNPDELRVEIERIVSCLLTPRQFWNSLGEAHDPVFVLEDENRGFLVEDLLALVRTEKKEVARAATLLWRSI